MDASGFMCWQLCSLPPPSPTPFYPAVTWTIDEVPSQIIANYDVLTVLSRPADRYRAVAIDMDALLLLL